MTADSNSGGDAGRTSASEPIAPSRPPVKNTKWYAVIIVLIFIAAGFAVLAFYHPGPSTGSSASISVSSGVATAGQPYYMNITTNGKFNSMAVYFGDGSSQLIQYSGSTTVPVSHIYNSPGNYYVYFTVNYGSSTYYSLNNLVSVGTTGAIPNQYQSFGSLSFANTSSAPSVNGTALYGPGANLNMLTSFDLEPANPNYAVVAQTLYEYMNGSLVNTMPLPYTYSAVDGAYVLPVSQSEVNFMNLSTGYYEFGLETTTAELASQSIPTSILNSTVISYASAGTYEYNTSAPIHLFGGNASAYMFYGITYNNSTVVQNHKGNQLSFINGGNVTYMNATSIALQYGKGASMNFTESQKNLTFDGYSNITFATNVTGTVTGNITAVYNGVANYSSYSKVHNGTMSFNKTTTYAVASDSTLKLNKPDMITYNNLVNDVNFTGTATVVYGAGSSVTDQNSNAEIMFNGNTTISYLNTNAFNVTYIKPLSVTLWYTLSGTQSQPSTNGALNISAGIYNSYYYQDVAVGSNVALSKTSTVTAGSTFTNAELVSGGITTLDPSIAYFTVDGEILQNTEMTLITYNKSSTSSFIPVISTTDGTPNTAWNNYTVNVNKAEYGPNAPAKYNVTTAPDQNWTFTIRSTAKWQNGDPVTAWDVMYSLTRTLLFDAGAPGTPGWIEAQYMLPGDYYTSNTFWNITQNMTVNNASNSITIHFQTPMTQSLVDQVLTAPGSYITSASWLEQEGAGITWTPAGFTAYEAQGSLAGYNTNIQFGDFSDGPYMVTFLNPSSEVVLKANPYYTAVPGMPAASIGTVVIKYFSEPSSTYLQFKNGAAQAFGLPSSDWTEYEALNATKSVNLTYYPSLGIFFYYFNANVNIPVAQGVTSTINMPSSLFTSLDARKAFADLFNLSQYLGVEVGNTTYHEPFYNPYQGMLPKGMLYAPTLSQIYQNVTAANFPGYNVSGAIHLWDAFINTSGSSVGLSRLHGTGPTLYNGVQLNVPFMIPVGDPVDAGEATVWAAELSTALGVTLTNPEITYTQLYQLFPIQGQNPMAINWGGWSPDYPYPADYMLPMADPVNTSLYMGANSLTSYWFNSSKNPLQNSTEASMMKNMSTWYNTAFANPTEAQKYFLKMDYEFVNMSFTIDVGQQNVFTLTAPSINQNLVKEYQRNVMLGPTGFMYNFLQYTS